MSGIIKDAQQLLDAATRGPWVVYTRSFGVIDAIGPIERDPTEGLDVDSGSAELAAAAPELAQALAEETYEYAVQFKNEESGKWYTNGFYGRGMHGRKWFASKEEAEQQIKRAYPADLAEPREHRIVRRRVSAPEVIE